ncbi:dynein axonemal intermediate chain 3 [Tribolium castaneum]|uniref:WD repeat-containing protein 63-like Protein n=1 Tax=Tribolium castaneum TaxID=7070 RepID=D7EI98_TRICA|nr:PREDICTED: WD repeat-containing protein 63 [Tribolium castaneum]EFA11749.1 WD repeat-containing protein 63-like Protein [Tribolium castaneum]|eukprot:XP_969078.1 PREDICTED: WD repeat-containing protein 63 [Tribolium castaneum]
MEQNPIDTAILSESETESHPKKTTPRRRRRRKKKLFTPDFNIPGVHKIVLPDLTQEAIGCVAGDHVTAEKPWLSVDKDLILEHLENFPEESEFLPLRPQLLEFPRDEVLMGYIPDESRDFDEFYICVTEDATVAVNEIVEKLAKLQEERLRNAIHRKVKRWKPLGSDKEIEEGRVKDHRALIEVEIESKYPILPFKVHFRLTKAQDLRDGYMELRPSDESQATIIKRRVDAFVQVAPDTVPNQAQTICTYPKNSYTQYEYEVPEIEVPPLGDLPRNLDSFCDILQVNGCIDLYSNDYENLVLNPKMTVRITVPGATEYFCFIDMNLCGNKMVSCLEWHPMWSGCMVASYVDTAAPMYLKTKLTTDEVLKAVHDSNPVLFWSFNDDLKPKLILETPRPVYSVSCCPYNANLIIGGCVNGQVLLWDITNKLTMVEEEEILTVEQQKYRENMFSLMSWMRNIFDVTLVRPTAVSDLKHSHRGCVTAVAWLSPFHHTSKTGKIEEIESDSLSLEFITAGEDGTVMIWDLLRKPTVEPGGFKAVRKLRRLKKKPSALLTMESPFKILHLNLKPVYKINLTNPMQNNRLIGVSTMYANFFRTTFDCVNREQRKNVKLADRLVFRPVINFYGADPRKTFYVGSLEGGFVQGVWEGQEFDSGEVVNFENCQFVNGGTVHDGPIVSIDYSPLNDTVLTVGGSIFALWRESFQNRPILWRKSKSIYTNGSWYRFEQASIKLVRMDGYMESWSLFNQSKTPIEQKLMSNGAVTLCNTHPRKIKTNVFALCDYRGSIRLFYKQHLSPLIIKAKEEYMSEFLTREIERKKKFLDWQNKWNLRHLSKEQVVEKPPEAAPPETTETKKKEERKKIAKISPGQRYLELVQEQHRVNEQQRIKSIILMKKQLDTEDLLKKREPLRKLEEENEVKKRKQKKKLKESDKIFKDTVAMLFPDVVKEKPAPPPDPYEDCYSEEHKKVHFDGFKEVASEAMNYVEENPFSYDFSWGMVLKTGRERRKKLDDGGERDGHRRRWALVKDEKARLAAVAAAIQQEVASSMVDTISIVSSMSNVTNF